MNEILLGFFSLGGDEVVEDGREALQTESLALANHVVFLSGISSFLGALTFFLGCGFEQLEVGTLFIDSRDVGGTKSQRLHVAEVHLLLYVVDVVNFLVFE